MRYKLLENLNYEGFYATFYAESVNFPKIGHIGKMMVKRGIFLYILLNFIHLTDVYNIKIVCTGSTYNSEKNNI